MKRGDWRPPRLTQGGQTTLMWALVVAGIFRAGYYYDKADDPNPSGGLTALEGAFPLRIWVILYALGGMSLALALLLRRWQPAVLGNGILGFTYSATGIAYFLEAIPSSNQVSPLSSSLFLLPGLVHLLFWQRTVAVVSRVED